FGERATHGKILAIKYARENNIPFFGICYGMQLASIEYARNVLGLEDANTTEINPNTKNPIIKIQPLNPEDFGGTLRLGLQTAHLKEGTKAYSAYGTKEIKERHRHRYEFNNDYKEMFESKGMVVSGMFTERDLVEVIELPNHPWFVAVQYHPEFLSRPLR